MPLLKTPRNKALLVILRTQDRSDVSFRESYEELKELTESALIRVLGAIEGNIHEQNPRYFIREGKLEEAKNRAKQLTANVLIFNVDLSPAQARNIEMLLKVHVMDRTGLILEIFGRRAKSKEGKLQVELAQLKYLLPRLGGLGKVMSRLGGGIGSRGPGEPELEHDRRKIRKRIQRVKEELEKVEQHRSLIRDGRKKKHFMTVAIIGYTNAGKSTLLNALTGAEAYVEDKLFATLDPMTRAASINGSTQVLFIDTVGFIRDLPHDLVESFHATLEEVRESDILLHVLDASDPHAEAQKAVVEMVLKEIDAANKKTVLVLNKEDLLDENRKKFIGSMWPAAVLVSAKQKVGLEALLERINEVCGSRKSQGKNNFTWSRHATI